MSDQQTGKAMSDEQGGVADAPTARSRAEIQSAKSGFSQSAG